MHKLRRRLSPSTLIATIALIAATGGTAVAADIIITSPDQIKDGVVTKPKLASDSVDQIKIKDRGVSQRDEINPSLRARIAKNGTILTGDVAGGSVQHVKGSHRYDVTFSPGDLGPLGLDTCGVAVSPNFELSSSPGNFDHRPINAYVNHAKGAANVQVFTFEPRVVPDPVTKVPELVEIPTEADFDLVLAC